MDQLKKMELKDKISGFESFIEESIVENRERIILNIQNYKHLVRETSVLPFQLSEELKNLGKSQQELVQFAIQEQFFYLEYEKREDRYDSPRIDEFFHLNWGRGQSFEISRDLLTEKGFILNWKLSDSLIETYSQFKEFVRIEFGESYKHLGLWWLAQQPINSVFVDYKNGEDVVRCFLDKDQIIKELSREKPKIDFEIKHLNLKQSDYLEKRSKFHGFCVKCGSVNESSHEPTAEFYRCDHCHEDYSFGLDYCLDHGFLKIK